MGDTHHPKEAKNLRQPPPHRNFAQHRNQVQTQPEASKQSTKGETIQLHISNCVNMYFNVTMLTSHESVQTNVLAINATYIQHWGIAPLHIRGTHRHHQCVCTSTPQCSSSNVTPTIVHLIYHQGLASSMPPSKQLYQNLIFHKCHKC